MISDARKAPWYLDLTPSEMEAVIAAVPALLDVAREADRPLSTATHPQCRLCTGIAGHLDWCAIAVLDQQHPTWRTWLTVEQEGRK